MLKKTIITILVIFFSWGYADATTDSITVIWSKLQAQNRADTKLFYEYANLCISTGRYEELIGNYRMLLDSAKKDLAKDDHAMLTTLCNNIDTNKLTENTVFLYFITGKLYTRYHLDNTTAQNYFAKSIRLAERLDDPCLIIRGYSGLGSFYMNVRHDIVIANQYFEKIDSVLLKKNMNGISECNVDVNISHAVLYYYMGHYATGCVYLDKSIAIATRLKLPQKLFDLYIRRSNFEIELGNRQKALLSLDTLEQIIKNERNAYELTQLINSYRFNVAVQEGRFADALLLSSTIKAEELNGTNDEYFDYLFHLCQMNIHFKNYTDAEKNVDLYQSTLKPWNIQRWRCVFQVRYMLNKALDKNKDALEYYERFTRLNDSVHHQQQIFAVIAEQIKFHTIQKEAEFDTKIGLLEKQSQLRKIYLFAAIVVLAMTMIIIVQFYRNNRKDKKNITKLTELNTKVLAQKHELEIRNREKDRILDVVAHDLRSPIGGIAALTDPTQWAETDEAQKDKSAALINRASAGALELVDELMEYSNESRGEIAQTQTEIVQLARDVVSMLQPSAQNKDQTIQLISNRPTILVDIDNEKIRRVLNNLVTNAVKFSHKGGTININITGNDEIVLLEVKDYGIGVPAAYTESVFDMFTNLRRRGTAGERSHGLGLSIARQIITLHKGKIWLESTEGKGSSFFVELPVSQSHTATSVLV